MIVLTSRPPQLETPFSVFNANVITPNDAFFVRYRWISIMRVTVRSCSPIP
jgi:sulfite dehydrogenase (cytochrome) subunit A